MTFGRTLNLPKEFLEPRKKINDVSDYVLRLRKSFNAIRPTEFKHKTKQKIFIHPDLGTSKRVYVRIDRVREPLEQPYEGPYTVLKRKKSFFVLDIKGKKDSVSINRLKPAYELLMNDEEATVQKDGTKEHQKPKKTERE